MSGELSFGLLREEWEKYKAARKRFESSFWVAEAMLLLMLLGSVFLNGLYFAPLLAEEFPCAWTRIVASPTFVNFVMLYGVTSILLFSMVVIALKQYSRAKREKASEPEDPALASGEVGPNIDEEEG